MNNSFSSFGLRTKETDKFCRFFSIVQNKAEAENKVFFLDSGEGRELLTDELEGEDLSGWLIPKDKAAFFETLWKKNDNLDEWIDFFTFAIWKVNNGKVEIEFTTY